MGLGPPCRVARHGTIARHDLFKTSRAVLGLRLRATDRHNISCYLFVACLGSIKSARPMTGSDCAGTAQSIDHVYSDIQYKNIFIQGWWAKPYTNTRPNNYKCLLECDQCYLS